MSNTIKSLASNTAWGAGASLIATICRMTTSIFLARYFSKEINGGYLLFGWFAEFLTLLICLGAPAVLNRFLALENANGNQNFTNAIIQWAWKRTAISALLVSIIYYFLISNLEATNKFSTTTLTLAVILLITQSLSGIANACLTGLQLFKNLALNNFITGILLVLFQCTGAYLFGINGALSGFIAANIISFSMIMFKIKENIAHKESSSKYNFNEIKIYALHSGFAALISAIVWSRSELFFLNQLSTPAQAAYFGVSISLVSAISLGVNMLTSAITPHFSARMAPNASKHRLQRDYSLLTILTAFFCIPSSIFASALMPTLIPIMFGAKYIEATLVAQFLVLSAGLGFANVGSSLQYASGNSKFIMKTSLIGAAIMFAGLYFAIGKYGAIGASIVRLATQVIMIFVGTLFNARNLNIAFPARPLVIITMVSILAVTPLFYIARIGSLLYCLLYMPMAVIIVVLGLKYCKIFTKYQSVRLYKVIARMNFWKPAFGNLNNYLFLK